MSTSPDVAGNCGGNPAMRRRTVDLPHPEGPRMVTNSILPGTSLTTNDTSLIAVNPFSYLLETLSKTTTGGGSMRPAGASGAAKAGACSAGAASALPPLGAV